MLAIAGLFRIIATEQRRDPAEMVESARSYLMRFNEDKSQFDAPRPPEAAAVWSPPISPYVKINVDASFIAATHIAGIGIVARNHDGSISYGRRRKFSHVQNAEVGETLAMDCGIDLALQQGWHNIIVESDCLTLVKAVQSSATCLSLAGHLVETIKNKSTRFNSVSLDVLQNSNTMAHELCQQVDRDSEGVHILPF